MKTWNLTFTVINFLLLYYFLMFGLVFEYLKDYFQMILLSNVRISIQKKLDQIYKLKKIKSIKMQLQITLYMKS